MDDSPQSDTTMEILDTLKFVFTILIGIGLTTCAYFLTTGHKTAAIWTGASTAVALILAVALHLQLHVLRKEQQMQDVEADQNSPLKINSYIAPGEANYPPGTNIAGIQWEKNYIDVRLNVRNEGTTAAQNIDLFVEFDTSIAAMGQLSNVPDVNFSTGEMPAVWLEGTDDQENAVTNPVVPVGQTISPVYRIFCPKLLAGEALKLVVASMALNPGEKGKLPQQLFAPRRKPQWVRVRGTYEMAEAKPPRRFHLNRPLKLRNGE